MNERTEDPIQQALDCCVGKLSENQNGFYAAHFLFGKQSSDNRQHWPSFLRRSASLVKECPYIQANTDDSSQIHRDALLGHVRIFDRSRLLIYLVANLAHELQKNIIFCIDIIENKLPLEIVEVVDNDFTRFQVILSKEFVEDLVPQEVTANYLRTIYTHCMNKTLQTSKLQVLAEQFDYPRAKALGMILAIEEDKFSIPNSLANCLEGTTNYQKLWNLLVHLQSTLVFEQSANTNHLGGGITCIRETFLSPEIATIVTFMPSFNLKLNIDSILETIGYRENFQPGIYEFLKSKNQYLTTKLLDSINKESHYGREIENIENEIKRKIHKLELTNYQTDNIKVFTYWMCLLAQKLVGAIHEGEALDFWFIAGEKTSFADDIRFKFIPFIDCDLESKQKIAIPYTVDKIDNEKIENAVRLLQREHFPWFHRGRNALLFDISGNDTAPVGLVEFLGSTWHQVIEESFKSKNDQKLSLPSCSIVYIDRDAKDTGLMFCDPRPNPQNRMIERVMRLNKSKWHIYGSQSRNQELFNIFNGVHNITQDEAHEFTDLCLRIADDLSIGGTLVFVKDSQFAKSFVSLGTPWDFGESIQISLIAHDGATLIWKDEGKYKYKYRCLLLPKDLPQILIKTIEKISLDPKQGKPLNAVGTRRWSAALTSVNEAVDLVVTISQDGDITCWNAEITNNEVKTLKYSMLPLEGVPETKVIKLHDFENR
jgi:hypothetical protein